MDRHVADEPCTLGNGDREPSVLDAALDYADRGWSVIPIAAATKKPPKKFSWKRFQRERPTKKELRAWFAGRDDLGLAILFGEVSGGLICRDYDSLDAYKRWRDLYPELAEALPTVETARGRHVYARAERNDVLAHVAGGNVRNLGDGELRVGGGTY